MRYFEGIATEYFKTLFRGVVFEYVAGEQFYCSEEFRAFVELKSLPVSWDVAAVPAAVLNAVDADPAPEPTPVVPSEAPTAVETPEVVVAPVADPAPAADVPAPTPETPAQ